MIPVKDLKPGILVAGRKTLHELNRHGKTWEYVCRGVSFTDEKEARIAAQKAIDKSDFPMCRVCAHAREGRK